MRSNCAIYVEPLEARACLDGSASSLRASLARWMVPELKLTRDWCSSKGECFSHGKALVKPRPGVEASVKRCPARAQRSGSCGSLYGCWNDGSTTLNRTDQLSGPTDAELRSGLVLATAGVTALSSSPRRSWRSVSCWSLSWSWSWWSWSLSWSWWRNPKSLEILNR